MAESFYLYFQVKYLRRSKQSNSETMRLDLRARRVRVSRAERGPELCLGEKGIGPEYGIRLVTGTLHRSDLRHSRRDHVPAGASAQGTNSCICASAAVANKIFPRIVFLTYDVWSSRTRIRPHGFGHSQKRYNLVKAAEFCLEVMLRHIVSAASLCVFVCLFVSPLVSQTSLGGENVNMVSGTDWTTGDPFLERQNEPSITVSTRNNLHLLAGNNDYRTVDLPGVSGIQVNGDTWLGVFQSFAGGLTWRRRMLHAQRQDS